MNILLYEAVFYPLLTDSLQSSLSNRLTTFSSFYYFLFDSADIVTLLFKILPTALLLLMQQKLKLSTSQPMHFQEIFRKFFHNVKENKGNIVKECSTDVENFQIFY